MNTSTELLYYQASALAEFYKLSDVTGQTILEISSSSPHAIPHDLILHGALSIVSVSDKSTFISEQVTDKILAINTNPKSLDFPDNTFDTIVSVTSLENLNTLSEVFAEAYRVLKPNGVMFITGAPLWSSKVGAYYQFTVDDIEYHCRRNPILSDWEHLTSSKEEIRSRLIGTYSTEVIEKLLDATYDNIHLNRLFPNEIIEIVSNSKFSIVSSELSIWADTDMPDPMKEAVKLKYPKFDHGYDELQLFLRKLPA